MGIMQLRTHRVAGGVMTLAAALALSGCGGGGSGEGGGGSGESSGSPNSDVAAFCEAIVAINSDTGPEVDFATASETEIKAAIQEYAKVFEPLVAEAERTAPDEVKNDVATQARLSRQALSTGDDSVFQSPEFTEADARVDRYMLDNCGYDRIETVASDYQFEGVPESVEGGPVAVTLKNEGEEIHEIALLRINDDVTLSAEELLALPQEEGMTKVKPAGFGFAEVGKSDTSFIRLEPGRYAVACFIPVGSKAEQEGNGPPHFTQGMFAELTVT
ncbi:MAG: hypothetical protein M3291_05480 [Actinomycetota bacterium]|nr:hypothetical protein [Actinomycetota bacterium]